MTAERRAVPTAPGEDAPGAAPGAPEPAWLHRFGRRNLVYLAFVALLIPFGLALEAAGPGGPDSGGGVMAAFLLWALGSAGFFLVNAALLLRALGRGQPAAKPLIACALPPGVVVLVMASGPFLAG